MTSHALLDMLKWMPRIRPRVYLAFLLLLSFLIFGIHVNNKWSSLPSHWQQALALHYSPESLRPYVRPLVPAPDPGGPPPFMPEVFDARWAGSWEVPKLVPPQYRLHSSSSSVLEEQIGTPAFLMLHVFSTSRRHSRLKRELIREYNLLQAVPPEYRHLVEIKFVLGLAEEMTPERAESEEGKELAREQEEEEGKIKEEQMAHGDIIRLKELKLGENMNDGKTLEWMRYVGREGGREAQWVFKCDDDTLPILPNLLEHLAKLDPAKPSYLGTSIGRWTGFQFYFGGMMYGFSWGVVKTIATANLSKEFIQNGEHEDARMGEIMCNLPSIPLCSSPKSPSLRFSRSTAERPQDSCVEEQVPFETPPPSGWGGPPNSPDPRSGLMRIDWGRQLGGWGAWAIPKNSKSIAWHDLKSESDYVAAYYRAHRVFEQAGRPYLWVPPKSFESVAQHLEDREEM